jgi:hypothetical protein
LGLRRDQQHDQERTKLTKRGSRLAPLRYLPLDNESRDIWKKEHAREIGR